VGLSNIYGTVNSLDSVTVILTDSWKLTDFFADSGVHLDQSTSGLFHFRRESFSPSLKAKVGSTLTKVVVLRVNLNIDGTTITSRTHTPDKNS
jgi:hypothetical protein